MKPVTHWWEFPKGMTVVELKAAIKDWPEFNEQGEPCEVWVSSGVNRTSPVTSICPLNRREYATEGVSADFLLESDMFK